MSLPANVAGGNSTTYNADNEQSKFNGTTLSYDANSNLTGDGTNTYTWDARNHLRDSLRSDAHVADSFARLRCAPPGVTGISGGVAASFVYDGFGRRMSKTISGATTQFLFDRLNPIQELNGSNGVVANLLTGLRIDEYFTRTDTATSAFLTDALGSTVGLVGSAGTIATSYNYDAANRLSSQSFAAGGNNLGNLSYGYDTDERLTSESGTLASLKLPQSVSSITYTATNQVNTWNGNAAKYDASSNLTLDPATNASLSWDSRNQLYSISGGPAASYMIQCEAQGRRLDDTGAYTGTNYYLDDKTNVAASNNVNGSNSTQYTYAIIPGSGAVISYKAAGATSVPIQDGMGSTLGLVSSANTLSTQWSYTPSGTPTLSGAQTPYPFLFSGMQYDPTGYYGEYNPALAHSVRGSVMPYRGQGSDEFGHAPGELPPKFLRTPTPWGRIGIDSAEIVFPFLEPADPETGSRADFPGNNPLLDLFEIVFGGGASAPVYPPRDYSGRIHRSADLSVRLLDCALTRRRSNIPVIYREALQRLNSMRRWDDPLIGYRINGIYLSSIEAVRSMRR